MNVGNQRWFVLPKSEDGQGITEAFPFHKEKTGDEEEELGPKRCEGSCLNTGFSSLFHLPGPWGSSYKSHQVADLPVT